ncbi:MAG: hypothetical protein LKG24_00180 [Lacticaseibacillus songhuajiangensis]|jgi:transposase|nr:hypothetical protein [Lacticaseibacillus songhuajiangensis]
MAVTTKARHFISVLVTANSTAEAIRIAKVSSTTAYKWLKNPEFKAELRQARDAVFFQSSNAITSATQTAVDTLLEVMNDKDAPTSSRVQAAKSILDSAYAIHADDISARLEELEQRENLF